VEAEDPRQKRNRRLTFSIWTVMVVAVVTALLIQPKEVPFVCEGSDCPLDPLGPTYDYQIGLRLAILGVGVAVAGVLLLIRRQGREL
jgi:hypothetical protein